MNKFDRIWCYEIVRLREQAAVPFVDSYDRHANRVAVEKANETEQRLLIRAQELARVLDVQRSQLQTRQTMRMGLLVAWLISFLLGISAGLASLGDSSQPVNVVWTIAALLLVPSVMLLVWLSTFFIRAASGGWLGHGFEMLVDKVLSRGGNAQAWRAWLRLISRAQAQRWWLALLTHSIWFWVISGMIMALMVSFSLRHYTFVWQTTWLAQDIFVQFAQAVGALPAKLGFVMPDAIAIKASGNVALDEPVVRLAWANWLVGALLVFGWLPRLILALISWGMLRKHYGQCRIDSQDAYALQLRQKLERLASKSDVDAPPGAAEPRQMIMGIDPGESISDGAVVVFETQLPADLYAQLPVHAELIPPVDDRASREHAHARLQQIKPARLLIMADARQTPDRGVVRAILLFGGQAVQTKVCLLHLEDDRARRAAWAKQLAGLGLTMPSDDPGLEVQWLRSGL